MNHLIKFLLILSVCSVLSGCQAMMYGTSARLNDVDVGMTKQEVVDELGEPTTRSVSDGAEIFKYKWMKSVVGWLPRYFYVKFVDGKVSSFGEERELYFNK